MSLFTRITVIALEWKLHYNSPRQLKSPPLVKAWKVAPLDLVNIWVSEISRVKWAEINWTVLMEASLGFLSIFFVDGWTTSFHLVRCLFKLLQHTINHCEEYWWAAAVGWSCLRSEDEEDADGAMPVEKQQCNSSGRQRGVDYSDSDQSQLCIEFINIRLEYNHP